MRILATLLCVAFLTGCQVQSTSDDSDIHALSDAYVAGWKLDGTAAQKAAVMPLFTEDAVVIPSGGRYVLEGHEAINGFWFPDGYAPTVVKQFDHLVDDVHIKGSHATFYGVSKLLFEYKGAETYQEARFLAVAEKDASGRWQFTHFTWTDRPKEN